MSGGFSGRSLGEAGDWLREQDPETASQVLAVLGWMAEEEQALESAGLWDKGPAMLLVVDVVGVIPLPLPSWLSDSAAICRFLLEAASVVRQVLDGETAVAVGLFTEGWGVLADPEEESAVLADAAAHRLGSRPDRQEMRLLLVADRGDRLLSVLRMRGQEQSFSVEPGPADREEGLLADTIRQMARFL